MTWHLQYRTTNMLDSVTLFHRPRARLSLAAVFTTFRESHTLRQVNLSLDYYSPRLQQCREEGEHAHLRGYTIKIQFWLKWEKTSILVEYDMFVLIQFTFRVSFCDEC